MSKRKKICCIYILKNKLNGKVYIGQTVDYYRRMNEYKNRKSSAKIFKVWHNWKKYMEILDYLDNSSVETIENDYEVKYITY